MSEKKTKSFRQRTIQRILPSLLVAFLLPLILVITVPFEIFGNNLEEFLFSASDIMPFLLLFALLCTTVIFFAIVFLPEKAYRIVCAVILALSTALFIQGTFLGKGESLAGDNLATSATPVWKKVLNLAFWIGIIAAAVILAVVKDKYGIISSVGVILAIVISVTQLVPSVIIAVSTEGVFDSQRVSAEEGASHGILTTKGLTEISSANNIYYFCVDRFDQVYAEEGYQKSPEVYEMLDGFTAFNDNISCYGHTYPGVSNLITNKKYDSSLSREDFLNELYNENDTINALAENGYKINLYTVPFYAYTDASRLPSSVANTEVAADYEVINKPLLPLAMVQIALFRCFPYVLKPTVANVNSATCNNYIVCKSVDGNSQYTTDMKKFWDYINENAWTETEQKRFSFIHIEGMHSVDYDENWETPTKKERQNDNISLKNSFKIIGKFISELKQRGLYENSTIIITGDHGKPANDRGEMHDYTLTALFYKPSGKSGETLKQNHAQVCHDNVWPTILKDAGITAPTSSARTLFDIEETENVKRVYTWHSYTTPTDEYIYEINGAGNDFNNWKLVKHNCYNKFIMD